jgi:serine/threonine protein kinase
MGDYVILDRIGEGGMGQVYKAQHKVMERIVALKTFPHRPRSWKPPSRDFTEK